MGTNKDDWGKLFLTVMGCILCSVIFGGSASSFAASTITGHVYKNGTTTPISNVRVFAQDYDTGQWIADTGTDDQGSYVLDGLSAGRYRVTACASCSRLLYVDELYPDTQDYGSALPVELDGTETKGNIDFFLAPAVSISGRVTDGAEHGISMIPIQSWLGKCRQGSLPGAGTDPDGYYFLTVPFGEQVFISTCATCAGQNLVDQWWNGAGSATDCNAAAPLDATESLTDINFVLAPGSSISGYVFRSDGNTPIPNLWVHVFLNPTNQWMGGTFTGPDGSYTLAGLPAGNYQVGTCATCNQLPYIDQFNFSVSTTVGETTEGINFLLSDGVLITGRVTDQSNQPLFGMPVRAFSDKCGQNQVGYVNTDWSNGNYTLVVPPVGQVYVDTCPTCSGMLYLSEWWDNASGTTDCNAAMPVTAVLGQPQGGIDFSLAAASAGTISGTVTHDGTPIANVSIGVSDYNTGNGMGGTMTDAQGHYSITLPVGTYRIHACASCNGMPYVDEFYNNTFFHHEAEAVTVIADQEKSGIDFALESGGTISGIVTQADGTPIPNFNMGVSDYDTGIGMPGAMTDAQGRYTVTLPAGSYRVHACASCNGLPYVDEFYNERMFYHEADPVTVVAGQPVNGIHFSLSPAASVTGRVTNAQNQPIAGMHVQAFSGKCWDNGIGGVNTDNDGYYTLFIPPVGQAYIRTCPECVQMNYLSEWWNDASGTLDCNAAVPVDANLGQPQTGIDFALDLGASISGTVRDASGDAITGVSINVAVITGDPCGQNQGAGGTSSNPLDGTYTIVGVPAGTYYLRTWNNNTDYVNEWWNGTESTTGCQELQTISLLGGDTVVGKDFRLDLGGTITGRVTQADGSTEIGNLHVYAQDFNSGQWMGGVNTDPNGNYAINGLPAGDYRVGTCASCNGHPYMDEFYNDTFFHHEADPVTVIVGQPKSGIDFSLLTPVSVSGRVTDGQNGPIAGMRVEAFSGKCWEGGLGVTDTDSDGYFTLLMPPVEEVYIRICPECNVDMSYLSEWWTEAGGTTDCNAATPFSVGSGQAVVIVPEPAGGISGRVTATGGQGIEGLHVQAFSDSCNWDFLGGANTDGNGNYTISGLPAGNVYVRACADCNHQNFINEFWNGESGTGTTDCNLAVPVTVPAGEVTSNINFMLEQGPARSWYFDISVTNGNLSAGFDLQPGFDPVITQATLSGPNGFFYEYDLANDEFHWTQECSYRVAWAHTFIGAVTYGDYTLSLHFADGVVQTSTRTLVEFHPVAVDPDSIAWTVNEDGSMNVSWGIPDSAPQEQVYQVSIFKDGQRYFTMTTNVAQSSLLIPVSSLRCLANGPASSYELQVRAYDIGQNGRENGTNVPFVYNPSALVNRVTYFEAASQNGYLSLYFNVRPGSRSSVSSATFTGPQGFSPYTFNLASDWFDMSTESRTLNGWWKRSDTQEIFYGIYTLTVDFSDGYQEVRTYTLNQVSITPVQSLDYQIYPDGAIRFSWINPTGVNGQKYNVRVRSEDESREYFSSSFTYGNEWTASFNDLRALEHGGTYKWFVRAYDENLTTMMQSEALTFVYDPFCIALCTDGDVDGDGVVDLLDAVLGLRVLSGFPAPVNPGADVDGDGKIGIAEVGYILQAISGNRNLE